MVRKLEAGEGVSQGFYFTAHTCSAWRANPFARSYTRLSQALERLQGTQIKTDIETGSEGEEGYFSWLSEARLFYSKSKDNPRDPARPTGAGLCARLFPARPRRAPPLDRALRLLGGTV